MKRIGLLALVCALAAATGISGKKKKEEDVTQVLQLPKELPNAVTAETRHLVFHVSPLSARGLLSQQVREALKALHRGAGGATIVKLRAFVAGTGDMRRVRDIVSETFTEHRLPLPALSTVQAGLLPLEGAQVVIESTAVTKKEVNPGGLVFISGQRAVSDNPTDPLKPLAESSLASVRKALSAAGSEPGDVLRVTCFLSSLSELPAIRGRVEADYRSAALNFVQTSRAPARAGVECEVVARSRHTTGAPMELLNPEGLPRQSGCSQLALVAAPQIALTGAQVAFGFQDSDARLAFERLKKDLESTGAGFHDVVFSQFYPLSQSIAKQVGRIRFEFFPGSPPPASTMQIFEGLPSMDASFAVDVVAVVNKQ